MPRLQRGAFLVLCSLALLACASANQRRTTDGFFDPYVVTLDLQAARQTATAVALLRAA